ncbi:MAG TPA: cytochrome o ubiquinol oxidase subunit IV [Gammaproteobacteria bacterium]|jgi:cytochrome o ubiquinol oxidase operon protein cyoD|nr:cytochrome o ubiquinol oxidase subunit IV [Gammaproteobacteria bacterium]
MTSSAALKNDKTLSAYLIGMILSLLLTGMAFSLLEWKILTGTTLYYALGVLAVIQFIIQSACFLRLNFTQEGRWHILPFLFTLLIIVILLGGSLWIMYHLNYNMYH